jgi:hypothetical protein
MGSSQENDTSLANRLQAEEDNLKKDEIGAIEIDQESSTEPDNTEMTHDDTNNSMTIEETSTDEILETHHPDSQAPASAVDTHTNTAEHVPVPKHMFQRLLQKGIIANDQQMNRPRTMMEACRSLEEILINFAEEDKASIGTFNNLIYLPQYLLEKYMSPTAKAIKKINDLVNTLFKEPEATMIKTLFTEASPAGTHTHDTSLNSITELPVKNTVSTTATLKDIIKGKTTALEKYVEQLRKAADLPDEQTIIAMNDEELHQRNLRLDQLFTTFETQIARDYQTFQKIRTENILLANMNYEQLKQLHKLTDINAKMQLEKEQLKEHVDGLNITRRVATIQKSIDDLKTTLSDKLTAITQVDHPSTDQHLKETNVKLKAALRIAVKTNEQIVKQHDELSLHYSFMPLLFREMVDEMKQQNDPIYLNQRQDPHNLKPTDPVNSKDFELGQVDIIEGDLNKYLQRTASLAYLLDTHMENNLAEERPSNDMHANANDHSQPPLAQPLRSEQDQNTAGAITPQPINGKRSGQDPIPHNAKQAKRDKPTLVVTELPTSQPSSLSITHKHTPIARGDREPRPFPYFTIHQEVVIYTMRTLLRDALCPYRIKEPKVLSDSACNAPTEDFLLERVDPEQAREGKTKLLYRSALASFNRAHKSTEQYCYQTVTKPRIYTSTYLDVKGEEVNPSNYKQVHRALDWQCADSIGDYYKVLRARPTPKNRDRYETTFEYLPNNVYSYEETRAMLWQHCRAVVKANRYWDDRFVRDLPKAVFYSLSDYCPGMPVDIKAECISIGLHPFRAAELQLIEETKGPEGLVYDTERTVETMVNNNTLTDSNTHTVKMYIEGCLNPAIDKYWELDKTWPFELPRLLIRHHAVRLKDLRLVLQEYTQGNKRANVKPNKYENSASSSARSYPQNTEQYRQGPNSSGPGGGNR